MFDVLVLLIVFKRHFGLEWNLYHVMKAKNLYFIF